MAADTIPILFDTDIGNDIDDAVALAYLLAQPRCELLGVTTVTGQTSQRAALAAAICDDAGRGDIPIHAGAPGPLAHGPGQPHVPQYRALADHAHRAEFPDPHAVEFLRRTIRDRPGEITLLAVGPMTNLALLFAADPDVAKMLHRLVMMCGVFGRSDTGRRFPVGMREWNALCDPLALKLVFDADPPALISVGLDVTTQCKMPAEAVRERFSDIGGPMQRVLDFAEVYFTQRDQITFHDPLAAALIFEPDLCELAATTIKAEPGPGDLAGLTHAAGDTGPHHIATAVDPDHFFDHYFQTVDAHRQ